MNERSPRLNQPYLFLSYASADRDRALFIAAALESSGFPVWIDRTGISGGTSWAEEIVGAVRGCAVVAVLCSAASMDSRNVRQEMQLAWDADRPILPMLLEHVGFPAAIAYFLNGRQWIDLVNRPGSDWMPDLIAALDRVGIDHPEPAGPEVMAPKVDLPVPATPLIGRDTEVEELVSRLQSGNSQLLTLTGPGGVGKTRLALEVAHRTASSFPGGAYFIDLAPVANPDLVASAIAQELDLHESGARHLRDTLRTALSSRPPVLLVLDNFEQVTPAAQLVSDLLAAAPALQILVTSREALRVRAEFEVVIQPLAVPTENFDGDLHRLAESPAVALFMESAGLAKAGFTLTVENAAAVAGICRRLDGLPLAIELAATRIRLFPPSTLLGHLDRRLPLLTGGPRDLPSRQQTLRDTIGWSYDLLAPDEQSLFRRLGIFAGGARLDAIEAVVPAAGALELDVLSGLMSLVDKSLLRQTGDIDGEPRFSMLETIREFAFEHLRQSADLEPIRLAHARHYLAFIESAGSIWESMGRSDSLGFIDPEIENLRSAFSLFDTQQDADRCARFSGGIWHYYYRRGLASEAAKTYQRTLDLTAIHTVELWHQAQVVTALALTTTILGDPLRGETLARESLDMLDESPESDHPRKLGLIVLAIALREQRRFGEALTYAQQAVELARSQEVAFFEAFGLYHVGKLKYLQGNLQPATIELEESLAQCRRLGATEIILYSIGILSAVRMQLGELQSSARLLREAFQIRHTEIYQGGTSTLTHIAGALAASLSIPKVAVHLLASTSAYTSSFGVAVGVDPWMEQVTDRLRADLGDSAFETAYHEGLQLSLSQSVALALEVLDLAESSPSGGATAIGPTTSD